MQPCQKNGDGFEYLHILKDDIHTAVVGEAVYNDSGIAFFLSTNVKIVGDNVSNDVTDGRSEAAAGR